MLQIDYKRPCNALVHITVAITEPTTSDGNKRGNQVIHVDNHSLCIKLEGHEHTSLIQQINDRIEELKKLWEKITIDSSETSLGAASKTT